MNSKKIVCSLILVGGLVSQTTAQSTGLPSVAHEKHAQTHITVGEGLQRHSNEMYVILMGDFVSDVHLGSIGDHDIGMEVGIVLKDGEQSLFFVPKAELFKVMGCKFFIKETIEIGKEPVHFVPGGTVEIPFYLGSFRGHCFVSGGIDHLFEDSERAAILETGIMVDLK